MLWGIQNFFSIIFLISMKAGMHRIVDRLGIDMSGKRVRMSELLFLARCVGPSPSPTRVVPSSYGIYAR